MLFILGVPALADADECEQIAIWRDGKPDGTVCRSDALRRGLVILDLSDEWVPTVLGLRDRLGDEARHLCHDDIDDVPVATPPARLVEESYAQASTRITRARTLRAELEADRKRKKLEDLESLASLDAYHSNAVQRLTELEAYLAAVRRLQAHLTVAESTLSSTISTRCVQAFMRCLSRDDGSSVLRKQRRPLGPDQPQAAC